MAWSPVLYISFGNGYQQLRIPGTWIQNVQVKPDIYFNQFWVKTHGSPAKRILRKPLHIIFVGYILHIIYIIYISLSSPITSTLHQHFCWWKYNFSSSIPPFTQGLTESSVFFWEERNENHSILHDFLLIPIIFPSHPQYTSIFVGEITILDCINPPYLYDFPNYCWLG